MSPQDYPDYDSQIFGHDDSISDLSSLRQGNDDSVSDLSSLRQQRRRRRPPRSSSKNHYLQQEFGEEQFRGVRDRSAGQPDDDSSKLMEEYTELQEEKDQPLYYLPSANSPEMRSIDERRATQQQSNVLSSGNNPSNVLAYILGGFGLCPPDQQSLDQDAQVNYISTTGNNNNNTTTNSSPFCAPSKQDVQLEEKKSLGEEKREDFILADLQETAQFPFNTKQFVTPPTEENEDKLVETGANFCALPGWRIEDVEKESLSSPTGLPPQQDEAPPPPGMKNLERQQNPDLEAGNNVSVVRRKSLLDSDPGVEDESISKLDQIRKKKRQIEHSVSPSPQVLEERYERHRTQLIRRKRQQRQQQLSSYTRKDKIFVGFFIFVLLTAAALVGVGFFWPQLMPFE
jgi:hypothetical protein